MKCKHCNSEIESDALFCPNCGEKVIKGHQCIKCGEELEEESDFCPHCGAKQSQKPQENRPKNKMQKGLSPKKNDSFFSKPWVIILLIALLCLFIYLLFFNSKGDKINENDLDKEEVISEERLSPEDSDSVRLATIVDEQQLKEDSLMKVAKQKSDSLAYLKDSLNNLKADKKTGKPQETQSATQSTRSNVARPSHTVQSGTKNLGYGSYKGNLVGGKPHGVNGRLIFKTYHQIDSRDPKGRMADPGDYVIGEFYDGHLVQGIWYDANNQVKGSIIIGR